MRYNRLGRTGLFVSELCLGTMTFGGSDGMWKAIGMLKHDEAEALLRAAIDAGINFIDTADVYAAGESETMVGQGLRNLGINRQEVVIATKGFGQMHDGPNGRGASRYHLIDACKASLKRLQCDHIDLYQVHGFDVATPIEETLEALDVLVRHGHVRYVGLSNWAAWQVAKAQGIAAHRGLSPIASLQAYYTLVGRELERDIVPMLQSEGVGLMVWSPLAGGLLSGKYSRDGGGEGRLKAFDFPPIDRERGFDVIDVLREVADGHGVSVAQVALAWLLHQPVVSSVIVGAKRPDQLADNLGAVDVVLSVDDLRRLDEVSALSREYPGWMLTQQGSFRRNLLEAAAAPRG